MLSAVVGRSHLRVREGRGRGKGRRKDVRGAMEGAWTDGQLICNRVIGREAQPAEKKIVFLSPPRRGRSRARSFVPKWIHAAAQTISRKALATERASEGMTYEFRDSE